MRWLSTIGCDGRWHHAQSIGGEPSDAIGASAQLMMVITVYTAAMMVLRLGWTAHRMNEKERERGSLALGGCCSLAHKSGLTDDWHVLIALAAFFRLNTLTNPHVVSSGVFCYAPNRPVRVCVFGSRIVWQRRWCVWDHHMILSIEKIKA